MLFICIKIGEDSYVIDTAKVVEVVPYAKLRAIPHAPLYLSGIFNYRGNSMPVIDLCCLLYERKCQGKLSTRIIVTNILTNNNSCKYIGLLCEGVVDTDKYDEEDFIDSGVYLDENKYLGRIITSKNGLMQEIDLDALIQEKAGPVIASIKRS